MAYSEAVAGRVRAALKGKRNVTEKKMFGGIAFMVRGHMTIGVQDDELMVRVGPDGYADALAQPAARKMDFTGKPLKGYVYVGPKGFTTAKVLEAWVERALAFNRTLEAK
jgi:TfoX/Sxy family transcriptional regulator of competence genes